LFLAQGSVLLSCDHPAVAVLQWLGGTATGGTAGAITTAGAAGTTAAPLGAATPLGAVDPAAVQAAAPPPRQSQQQQQYAKAVGSKQQTPQARRK